MMQRLQQSAKSSRDESAYKSALHVQDPLVYEGSLKGIQDMLLMNRNDAILLVRWFHKRGLLPDLIVGSWADNPGLYESRKLHSDAFTFKLLGMEEAHFYSSNQNGNIKADALASLAKRVDVKMCNFTTHTDWGICRIDHEDSV